ncbi:hypothetical protein C5167_027658 [Papaver somniferum]|uniref:UDP-glycosyltransferase 89B2-like n=1 Tax=Papaver somniferum TaxID=3469 RepID=UPI000E6FF81F|nr:UDP-glycosyltransferase 89B2-like [Papaver somniferum]RZC91596.1 hypothetical protein C5167_027658 [Papaver somniferum]
MSGHSSKTTSMGKHILVFPFPAPGHILPLLDLTHQLALRGLIITVLVTPKNLPSVQPLLARHPSCVKTLVLPFPTATESSSSSGSCLPPGIENLKDLPTSYIPAMIHAMGQLQESLLEWFRLQIQNSSSPPTAILSDLFLGWTQNLAVRLDIVRIAFFPMSAHNLSIFDCFVSNLPPREDCKDPNHLFSASGVPTSPVFPIYQIHMLHHLYADDSPLWKVMQHNNSLNKASWGIILNSFPELEESFLNHLRNNYGDHGRVWGVGPLLPPIDHHQKNSSVAARSRGGPSSISIEQVMSWLDSCAENRQSVLYVCFGSQIVLNRKQIEVLAMGLELSQVKFIWCVKGISSSSTSTDDEDIEKPVLPTGFVDRVAGQGLVIKGWAPQVAILSHQAMNTFLTHCGWNSVLEGLAAGVQLLLWPMINDHFMTAKLLETDLGVAVKICEGADTVPNSTELARVIAESVPQGEEGKSRPQIIRAVEMGKMGLEAVKEGGSSFKNLDELVSNLNELSVE